MTSSLQVFNASVETHDDVQAVRLAALREFERGSLSAALFGVLLPELDRMSAFISRAGVAAPERGSALRLDPPESLLRFATGIEAPLTQVQFDTVEESIALEGRLGVRVPSGLARLIRRYLGTGAVRPRRRVPSPRAD